MRMNRKSLIAILTVVAVLSLGAVAFAQGPGYGRGGGYGMMDDGAYGRGPGMMSKQGYGRGAGFGQNYPVDEATAKIMDELFQKRAELNAVLAAPKVDEAKATALHAEIIKLRNGLAEKRFASMLEFRKNNPDVRPGYASGYGCGFRR